MIGTPTFPVLPPDYDPADFDPYAPRSKFNQGMLSPIPMPVNQTLVPTGGYGTGTNYILMGSRMLTPSNGYAPQPMMPLMSFYSPYTGMFSQAMPQPIMDPYALPTRPVADSFGGYTNYSGVTPQFIDIRRRLIDAIAQNTGRSPMESAQMLDSTGFLGTMVTGMGGTRYGQGEAVNDPGRGGPTGGFGS